MKRFFAIFLAFYISLPFIWANDRVPLNVVLPALESYVEEARIAEGIPGVSIVVVKDGKVVYIKGFGEKILGQKDPVDGHTPFALASVTKTFTNTLVARLVDQGKFHWNDKVLKYLPDFQLSDSQITEEFTLKDLLSHRSGLPGFSGDSLIELGWSASEIMPVLKELPKEGEFRKTYDYQNVLVGLMGMIMEKVTRKPLSQLYQEELFNPLNLQETRLGTSKPSSLWEKILNFFRKSPSQPAFHDSYKDKTRYLPKGNPGLFTFPASSGVITTAHDMGKWLIFQLNRTVLNGKPWVSAVNLEQTRTPHVDVEVKGGRQFPPNRIKKVQYGMGWFIHDYMDVPMLSHMGGMVGTRAFVLLIPGDNVGIAVMSNLGGMRVSLFPEAIRNKFLDLYLNVPDVQDWAKILREDLKKSQEKYEGQRRLELIKTLGPAKKLEDYVGTYENKLYGRVTIGQSKQSLTLTYRDRSTITIDHWNQHVFQFKGSDLAFGLAGVDQGEVIFSDEAGKSNMMMINLFREGADGLFRRIS